MSVGLRAMTIAACAASLTLLSAVASADPFALIASARGKVEVVAAKGGPASRATFGRPLERGDKVVVGASGAATIYFSDGNLIELSEKSSVTVGGRVANAAKVGPGAEIASGVYAQVSKVVAGGSRQSGLVALSQMRGVEDRAPAILAPRRSSVLSDRPSFVWRDVKGATRYRVTVSGDQGELWHREVAAGPLPYPADAPALAGDTDFLWTIEALSDTGPLLREETAFHVVSPGIAESVRADIASIGQSAGGENHPAARFLLGKYEMARGLFHDAADQFTRLGELAPDSPAPQEALGDVYRAIGLMDLAAAAYQKALELTKAP